MSVRRLLRVAMTTVATAPLLATFSAAGCGGSGNTMQMVPMYDHTASSTAPPPLVPPAHAIGCDIESDRQAMSQMAKRDECLGASRRACWSQCESTCRSCGAACAGDSACEQRCLQERDTCKENHCVDVHAQCRKTLVLSWLSNDCDSVCAPFRACVLQCSQSPSSGCRARCDAMGTAACNPNSCDALLDAPERKTLDPRWQAHDCDRVCRRVWRCAEARCDKSSCGEPGKMYLPCAARVAGAKACGLAESRGLCPEP